MIRVDGSGWIGDTYYDNVAYLPAKFCEYNPENFEKEVKVELGDVKIITEVYEGYYRCVRSDEFSRQEYGDYCYAPCEKGKGATLYYFAAYEDNRE